MTELKNLKRLSEFNYLTSILKKSNYDQKNKNINYSLAISFVFTLIYLFLVNFNNRPDFTVIFAASYFVFSTHYFLIPRFLKEDIAESDVVLPIAIFYLGCWFLSMFVGLSLFFLFGIDLKTPEIYSNMYSNLFSILSIMFLINLFICFFLKFENEKHKEKNKDKKIKKELSIIKKEIETISDIDTAHYLENICLKKDYQHTIKEISRMKAILLNQKGFNKYIDYEISKYENQKNREEIKNMEMINN
tara:strand:- start:2172 stop:2912 length:741 start_codon:yes stop_codon:yes gene_type:complete